MTNPVLYTKIRYKWHIVALRVAIIIPLLPIYQVSKLIYEIMDSLADVLDDKLPDPRIIERVPFEELSEKQKKNLQESWKRFGRKCPE